MNILKNNHNFYVNGLYSMNWFSNNKLDTWEQDTFQVLEYYKNKKDGIYIDIGAWIGPTVLYAANIFSKVLAIEPDPIALERLEENLKVNNFKNINVIKKALSNSNSKSKFGGNGELGNSESTLLVSYDDYSSWGGHRSKTERELDIIEVETITIETLLLQQNIIPSYISLIKMDIEGGELILVPYLKNFLKEYKPVFYISLHYGFLKEEHIILIIDILFDIYDDNCYTFSEDGIKQQISKQEVIELKKNSIVFEKLQ